MKNYTQIQSDVVRIARIESTDSVSLGAILVDANDAIGIVAAARNWDELYKTGLLTLALADGDKDYPLSSNVDVVEQVRITLPVSYAKPLRFYQRKDILALVPAKTNNGTSTPNAWYFTEPTISSDNVETKQISFDFMPDRSYTVGYTYRAFPPLLTTGSNYPFFDGNYHQIIVTYCIWKYAERNPDQTLNPDAFEMKWNDQLMDLLRRYNSKVVDNAPIPGPGIMR